jgi:hypothetical protein
MHNVTIVSYVARKNYSFKCLIFKATRKGATFNFTPLKAA